MSALLAAVKRLYAAMLGLYPRQFRDEFGLEMQGVFSQLSTRAAAQGLGSLAVVLIKEFKDLPLPALRQHWQERKELYAMENPSQLPSEKPAPGWAIAAIICLFLAPGVVTAVRLPIPIELAGLVAVIFIILLFFLPLGIGIFKRLPRWSLVYFGVITGILGIYLIFTTLERALEPQILRWMQQVIGGRDLVSRLWWQWFNQARFWLSIVLANAIFLGAAALLPWFRHQMGEIRKDLSQLSFLFYGGILIIFFIDFDEYRYDELYQLGSLAFLALGAWGYLKAGTIGRRTLALLGGLTGCMLVMGVGKYILVPQQDWSYWLSTHPPESERWFESLRTIATWFWAALAVGLPGLIQVLRRRPPAIPQEALEMAG
jgi:hypothetical protein